MTEAENRISRARRILGVGQQELADMLGVHRSTVTRMENGGNIKKPVLLLLDRLEAQTENPPEKAA
jgi:DNA-binding XRE family transcriptional regulator